MKTLEMEIALATWWNYRSNLIIPRISWGFDIHECDLLIVSSIGYLTEIEIKVSKTDLKNDINKTHKHFDKRIRNFYFAVPMYLKEFALENIQENAGLIIVDENARLKSYRKCIEVKKPIINKDAKKLSIEDQYKIARLGALKIWNLKKKINILIK
jgi:hypothetical protein